MATGNVVEQNLADSVWPPWPWPPWVRSAAKPNSPVLTYCHQNDPKKDDEKPAERVDRLSKSVVEFEKRLANAGLDL
jgi:endothelin-converting enzyme